MPFDYGFRLNNRQRIANAKPIEANKNQSVEVAGGLFLGSGSAENVYLLPQRQNFRLASSINPPGTTEQYGTFARVAGQVVSGKDYSLHIGGDAEWLIQPPHNLIAGTQTLTLSDRPELRIDPTTLVSTGALPGVSGAQVYSAEAAGAYGPLFFSGEYFLDNVGPNAFPPLPTPRFHGGHSETTYSLTRRTPPH